jgi:hypothetical protein
MEEGLPWEDVEASRSNRRLQRKHPVAEGKTQYLAAAAACPGCGTPPDELTWFYFESSRETVRKSEGAGNRIAPGGQISSCRGGRVGCSVLKMQAARLPRTGERRSHCLPSVRGWLKLGRVRGALASGRHRRLCRRGFRSLRQNRRWPLRFCPRTWPARPSCPRP